MDILQNAPEDTRLQSSIEAAYQIRDFVFGNWSVLDDGDNGFLVKNEIGLAYLNHGAQWSDGDTRTATIAYHSLQEIQRINDDEFFQEDDGATLKDFDLLISGLAELRSDLQDARRLSQTVLSHFEILDANNDGSIAESELRAASSNELLAEDLDFDFLLKHSRSVGHDEVLPGVELMVHDIPISIDTHVGLISKDDLLEYPLEVRQSYGPLSKFDDVVQSLWLT